MAVIFLYSSISDPFRAFPQSWKEPRVETTPDRRPAEERIALVEQLGRNGHVLEYTVLGFLVYRSLWLMDQPRRLWPAVALTVALCFVYALSDEIHQSFVPFRAFQPADLLLDSLGALAGALVAALRFTKKKKEAARV